MKNNPSNKGSTPETILLLFTLALLWGGFVGFGEFISAQGFFAVSWKWQLGSVLIAAVLFLVSLFILIGLVSIDGRAWKIYVSIKNHLEQKLIILLAFSLLVLALAVLIFLFHRIRGLIGINLFSLLLLWLFLLPVFLFVLPFLKKRKSPVTQKALDQVNKDSGFLHRPEKFFASTGRWNAIWMGLLFAIYIISFFTPWSLYSLPSWLALLLYLPLAFLFSLGMRAIFPDKSWRFNFIASLFLVAAGAILVSYFTQVSNNPFSLSWSEGTWIFNGSLIFAKLIYGVHLNPPILYANRAILQSIPFLLYPSTPSWVHRLWQAVLWSVLPVSFGILFSKRLGLSGILRFMFITWTFLFLQQGPVYYFLFLAPILILLAGKFPRFWLVTLIVVMASVWIGIDRVNWFPVPGCLMALMFLFETKYNGKFWTYWWKPLVWIVGGTLVAFAARYGLWLVSGYPGSYFLTSVTSNLLTYRLLPNSTNPLGILPMISLTILPIVVVLLASLTPLKKNMHWSRRWMLILILVVFFLGDMLVSLKIGGGNNLHNFDAFLLLLVVSFSMSFFGKIIQDDEAQTKPLNAPAWTLGLVVLIPVLVSFVPINLPVYSKTDTQSALDEINQQIASLPPNAKPVLFITQTQLLATKQVRNVLPIPRYEMDLMMEMAMANNLDYLNKLYSDLSNQRYSLIIAPELNTLNKGAEWAFGEENDAWNNAISVPVLHYYHPIFTQDDLSFEILVPNTSTGK